MVVFVSVSLLALSTFMALKLSSDTRGNRNDATTMIRKANSKHDNDSIQTITLKSKHILST